MIAWLETIFATYASVISIEFFVFLASVLEEVVPPIPAFPITIMAGNLAGLQGYSLFGVLIIAVLGAIGKTIGATLIYYLVKKVQSIFILKYGRFFGVNDNDVLRFHKYLTGSWRDYLILTTLRAIPIFPSAITTVASGVIGLPIKLYVITTLIGSIIRYSMYLYAGYYSSEIMINYLKGFESGMFSKVLTIVFILGLVGFFIFRFYREKRKQ